MRELKFRVWDSEKRIMFSHDWLYSACVQYGSLVNNPRKAIITMQYTGLKDKNGKEIYEGDIIKGLAPYDGDDNEQIFEMKYHQNGGYVIEWSCGFNGGESDLTLYGWAMEEDYEFEIIGNIYENENLLSNGQ